MTSGLGHMEPRDADSCVAAITAVLESLLAEEFREAGVAREEIICIRHVTLQAPDTLDWRDVVALREWLRPVAREIRAELLMDNSPGLLRFRDETAALTEFADDALDGRAERAWAWRRMDYWPEGWPLLGIYALPALRSALWRRKGHIPALLRAMAMRGKRGALLACIAGRRNSSPTPASRAHGGAAAYRL